LKSEKKWIHKKGKKVEREKNRERVRKREGERER
jgi:hypothetical protein